MIYTIDEASRFINKYPQNFVGNKWLKGHQMITGLSTKFVSSYLNGCNFEKYEKSLK